MPEAITLAQTFDRLSHRYQIEGWIEAVTALRIGAEKSLDMTASNLPVIRDARGLPYLPGSSLKGVLRSGLESVLRSLDRRDLGLWSCDIFEDRCTAALEEQASKRHREPMGFDLDEVRAQLCTVCSLFGSPLLAGRAFIHDLPVDRKSLRKAEVRDGVGINRDLGTAQTGAKYDFEVVPVGARFRMEILLENVDAYRLALMLKAMEMLDQGQILIGGFTSRGLGRVCLKDATIGRIDAKRLLCGKGYEDLGYPEQQDEAETRLLALLEPAKEASC